MQRNRPTLVDVATAAGVSRSTVSRVVNGDRAVGPDARERVRRAIGDLGYRPDAAARALASGRRLAAHDRDLLDLVVVECDANAFGDNPFYGRVIAGVSAALAGTDVDLRLHLVTHPDAGQRLEELGGRAGLGTLLVNVEPSLAEQFRRQTPRVVALGRSAPTVAYAEPQNAAGARLAVRHLIETGRRCIGAIDGLLHAPCAADRHAGYLTAMREAGLPTATEAGYYRRQGGIEATRRLLAEHPDLDAIFAACDLSATGALQALAGAGRRVPDDVAVVGFDGSVLAACANPPLTSVWQPVEDMTAAAARHLLHDQVGGRWRHVVPVSLSIRDSSAA
jgi:DNA-binding LacI/PurR family transcriptional regulator